MSRVVVVVAVVIALGAGFGIGALVFSNGDEPDQDANAGDASPSPSPIEPNTADGDVSEEARASCLSALDAVEARSEADEEGQRVLAQYEMVLQDAVEALRDLDTPRLEEILSRVEKLNERAEESIDDASNEDLSNALESCREALGVAS